MIYVDIIDSYPFRSCLEILVALKESVTTANMVFTKERITIYEFDANCTKSIKMVLRAEDICIYDYDVRDVDGELLPSYAVEFNIEEILGYMKIDGKKDQFKFYITIDPLTRQNKGMSIIKTTSYEAISNISAIMVSDSYTHNLVDHYENFYVGIPCECKMSTSSLVSMTKMYVVKKGSLSKIVKRRADGSVWIAALDSTRQMARFGTTSIFHVESGPIDLEDTFCDGPFGTVRMINVDCILFLSCKSLSLIQKCNKLSPSGLVKIYLEKDHPFVIVINISNYGTCILSFSGDHSS